MIIIDTNVISEMMKPSPMPAVISWVDSQEATQLFITTITIAEIFYGINVLPDGNRRRLLEESFDKALKDAFKHRVLSFDETAAHFYGKIMSQRKILGRPLGIPDGQIVAIARTHNFSIATRNIRDFADCEVDVINPFVEY
jgi:toxin FitB